MPSTVGFLGFCFLSINSALKNYLPPLITALQCILDGHPNLVGTVTAPLETVTNKNYKTTF